MTEARSKRRRWPWIVAVVLLLGAASVWAGLRVLAAKSHLDTARAQLTVARSALLDRDLAPARAAVGLAGTETRAARTQVDDPVVTVLSHVPLLGRSFAVVRGVAHGADDIARRVLPEALTAADQIDPDKVRRTDGSVDVPLLIAAQPSTELAAGAAERVSDQVDELPSGLLPGPVGSARAEFVDQADELASTLQSAADALRIAPPFLGQDKPRRWLVLIQQTSETRGTGGLPGGYAVLETSQGKLTVSSTGSNADLPEGRVDPIGLPADYVDRYEQFASFDDWRNVNISPDLPVVSQYVVQRWKAQKGQVLDGVIAMDAKALADLLQGSGPVRVSPTQTVPPEGIEQYLAIGQYEGTGDQLARKEQLSTVAAAVVKRLTTGGGDDNGLLRGLVRAVRSGHLRLATQDDAMAPVLRRTGADGGLPRDGRPFVYPVIFNGSGGKLEYFLDRTVRYEGSGCGGSRRRTKVTFTLRSDPPAIGALPPYVTLRTEDGVTTNSLVDRLGVSLYTTKGARLVELRLDGRALPTTPQPTGYVEQGTEAGLPVWLTYVDLPPRETRTLEFLLDEPVVPGDPAALTQPLARGLQPTVSLPACS